MQPNQLFNAADFMKLEPRALAERSGDRNFNGPRNIYRPEPIVLAIANAMTETSYSTVVRMRVPDSRTRVKLSVLFFPTSGGLPSNLANLGTIWVAAAEEDQKGISGSSGRVIPVTDLAGTSTAPISFPVSDGLYGYSREFVTSADWIEATIAIDGAAGVRGAWVLQARIQPDAVTFSWDEWDQIRRLFEIQNLGGQGSL